MTDICRKRGDTYANEITVRNKSTKQPINVAGYSFLLTVDPNKAPENADDNLFQLVGTIIDAQAGRVAFAPTEQQANQAIGVYYYDIQMTDGAGRKRTIFSGRYKFEQDITK